MSKSPYQVAGWLSGNGHGPIVNAEQRRTACAGCGQEIDPEVCGCGDSIDHFPDGHSPIPMGCDCGRDLGIDDETSEDA